MPINIQEVFYPSDSDQIKWEKVNYNFDQILVTGGKEGPKGEKGSVGATGTGLKGQKGEIGDTGAKGEIGISTNTWDQFDHPTISAFVIKPKDTGKTRETAVVIGDNTYEDGVSSGILAVNAQLTVLQDSEFLYAQKWYPSVGSDRLTIRGEQGTVLSNPTGTKWIIQPEGVATSTRLELRAQEVYLAGESGGKVYIESATGVNILGAGNVTITPAVEITGTLTVQSNVTVNSNLLVTGIGTFSGTSHIKIPVGTTIQRPGTPESGMIRFNATGFKYEGYSLSANAWLDLTRLSNSTKSTYVAVELDSDYSQSAANKVVVVSNSIKHVSFNENYASGLDTVTAGSRFYKNLELDDTVYFTNIGKGLVYKAGAASNVSQYAAPNNGSTTVSRQFRDYFRTNYIPTTPIRHGSTTITTTYYNPTISSFDVSYVKTGDLVSVNGKYTVSPIAAWTSTALSGQLNIFLGSPSQFPYTNASGVPVLVDIKIISGLYVSQSPTEGEDLPLQIYGIIEPGSNIINLYTTLYVNNLVSDTWGEYDIIAGRLNSSLQSLSFDILFNFQMYTGVNSYTAQSNNQQTNPGGGLGGPIS